jgi:hypothetical protein
MAEVGGGSPPERKKRAGECEIPKLECLQQCDSLVNPTWQRQCFKVNCKVTSEGCIEALEKKLGEGTKEQIEALKREREREK